MTKDGKEHLYTYNSANQLTQETINGPATVPVTVTGTVSDANGIQAVSVNGVNATLNGNDFTCQLNLSPGANTLTVSATDVAGNTATKSINVIYNQAKQITYTYDNNGNLTSKQSSAQTLNLSYDYENRLNSVVSGAMNIAYSYDGEGKRISTTNGFVVTNYLYDGKDAALERNNAGVTTTSYLRVPNTAGGIGGIINAQQGTNPENYYSYDGLGSVANLSDVTGTNLQSYSYDAFGNQLNQSTAQNTRQFLTKETDLSGLIYFGARYYDPAIGRFITQDPLGMVDGLNMYLYCGNDPINYVDLWGLCGSPDWLKKAETINNFLQVGILGSMLFQPELIEFEVPALIATGVIDLGLSGANWAFTGNPSKFISSGVGIFAGAAGGRLALKAAGMSKAAFNWGASRFYSPVTGQFISNVLGRASTALSNAAGSIAGSLVSIVNSFNNNQ